MYIPKFNVVTDTALLHELMRAFNFATLVTTHEGAPFATHLPFLIYPEIGAQGTLVAHMARGNAQWTDVAQGQQGQEALVIFQGAHTYISPSWYAEPVSVPTWNYTVVHAYGVPRVIEDEARVREVLQALVDRHEGELEEPWQMELPEEYLRKQQRAIVAFEIPIARLEGKFKLSQNRSAEDRRRVIERLLASADVGAQEVGTAMQRLTRDE
jgi:transcriptional regulator